jgi:S-DNA-T family DNA segregation ATPase FtsK/SpoIIIE
MTDIVFLQDVISRQAQIVWISAPQDSCSPQSLQHFPARWSRRHPTIQGDMRSTVYLVCPSQLAVGTIYLDIIHDVVGEQPENGKHFLPARQVLFQDEVTQRIFQEVHQLGEWVVNYDDLLEKRSLHHQGVTVIKYQQNRSQDRNLIISSTSSFQLLHVLVKQRLEKLSLGGDTNIDRLASKCIDEAKTISGDIVLRAARRGANASELIGLVLSKHLLCSELQTDEPIGWFFLDDYANWLGQEEQQIADIMALALSQQNGKPILRILITEAKYVETNVAEARKTSQKQLKETIKRIQDALFQHNPSRLDRDIWLARLSDLLIDGILVSSRQSMDIYQWRESLRRGELQIEVKGYSHVFAPFVDSHTISEDLQFKIPGVHACYQEVFGRKHVQDLVLSLYRDKSSLPIRESIGDHRPWQEHSQQLPVPGTLWKTQVPENAEMKQNGAIPAQKTAKPQYQYISPSNGEILDIEEKHSQTATDILKGLLSSPFLSVSSEMSLATQTKTGQIASQVVVHEKNDQWSREILETLQRALLSYSLQAKVLGSRLTPNALLIRLKGSDRLRVEDIEKKKSVLLTTHGLSILNIIAQPGEIVVSIARPQRETVSLQEVWRQRELFVSPGEINFCFILGIKEMDGEILYLNLGKSLDHLPNHAPHTLIAGTTGSGKSVLMQNLLLDICKTNASQSAHIYLIDPKKGVDYQQLGKQKKYMIQGKMVYSKEL